MENSAIFDMLYGELQALGATGFAYFQIPHIGAYDFENPLQANRGKLNADEIGLENLDSKTIRKFVFSISNNIEGDGYCDVLRVDLKVDSQGTISLSLSSLQNSEHISCLTRGPLYNFGCFLIRLKDTENQNLLHEAYKLCNQAQRALGTQQAAFKRQKYTRSKLTNREKSVMELMVQGKTTPQISDYLGISTHTVSSYIQHITLKLNVESRISAAFRVVAEDLIEH